MRPGGVVAYVTCSPHTAETVDVVDAAAAAATTSRCCPWRRCSPRCPTWRAGDYAQLWPHRHGTDAMFMALLRRTR